ncbi:MAG: dipeptidase [Phycisphaerales bacterium]|nr:dipeptidase [Phycisphaerales bacterium]
MELTPVLEHLERDQPQALARLFDLLRIPSISTDPAHKADCARAAEWMVADLRSMGFNAATRATAGHPMVLGHMDGPPGAPRILFYGHYDVQPVDPISLWRQPPFEPHLEDGKYGKRIVARGAVDDKGLVMCFLEACRAWRKVHGTLPCGVTVFLEGEEESGSPSFEPFLNSARSELQADICLVSDTGMWDIDTPSITAMLRGLVYMEVTLHGPSRDLHSGGYGGAVPNPCNVLASIIGQMHDSDRRVMLDGFYDAIEPLPASILAEWKQLSFSDGEFLGDIGISHGYGEAGTSTLERIWSRPTLDCNGICGGYTGPGAKTVIGTHASAKLSCRLVPGQDPARVAQSLRDFVTARLPRGCRAEFQNHGQNPALLLRADSPMLRAAAKAMEGIYKRKTVLIGAGGSIPAVGMIKRILGLDSMLVGFGLDDDGAHSPNEKFELRCFANGARSQAAILGAIGALRP